MKLTNEMVVPASVDEAWAVMLDIERVAPCLPGASIEASEGDEYTGTMKLRLGPITSSFSGTIKIEEADEATHRAVLSARARDSRGKGTAAATITSTMAPADDGTSVTVETDLRVTGPAASFGRGVMQDVSARLMSEFAECLAAEMGRSSAGAVASSAAGGLGSRPRPSATRTLRWPARCRPMCPSRPRPRPPCAGRRVNPRQTNAKTFPVEPMTKCSTWARSGARRWSAGRLRRRACWPSSCS